MKNVVLVRVLAVTLVMFGMSLSAMGAVIFPSGGTATAFGPDWIYNEGANGFAVIDGDSSGSVKFLFNAGSTTQVDLFKMTSVPYAASWNIKDLKIFVASDEASIIANDLVGYASSYTEQVFSGTVFDASTPASTVATVNITSSTRRYFMFEVSSTAYNPISVFPKAYSGEIEAAQVPEPISIVMLGLGIIGLIRRQK